MTSLARLGPMILENRCCTYGGKALTVISRSSSSSSSSDGGGANSPSKTARPMVTAAELEIPQANSTANETDEFAVPTTCCMSGCANCVWIQYAELLSEKLKSSDEDLQKMLMEKVEDPNMRAFLSMELRCRNLGKS